MSLRASSTPSRASARRKGVTVKFCRRVGKVYDRAIQLVTSGRVNLNPIATHHVPLGDAPEALALQSRYDEDVIKVMVTQPPAA
jgi:L-iditol 2-dehydrogenase